MCRDGIFFPIYKEYIMWFRFECFELLSVSGCVSMHVARLQTCQGVGGDGEE